ncbi:MAG: Abi family protein [Clostridia bacterium]|nr:Abi family protein [Clostridia bacterium]
MTIKSTTDVVKHHISKYNGQFPIWVVIEFFSMGMLSFFYSDLKAGDQKRLAYEMYGPTAKPYVNSWLRCLTELRNQCAHFSRLYYWKFSAVPKLPPQIRSQIVDDRHVFIQIALLKCLYPEPEKWNDGPLADLESLIDEYQNDITLDHIGFQKNWKDILRNT